MRDDNGHGNTRKNTEKRRSYFPVLIQLDMKREMKM